MLETRSYYEGKTEAIIERYGPGPIIHYHTGLMDGMSSSPDAAGLKHRIVESQARLLDEAASAWHLEPCSEVLDIGCGLGGGSIYWASRFGCTVTALTFVESHIPLIHRFTSETHTIRQIRTLLCDAHEVALLPDHRGRYDAVIAIDSSCHLDRWRWLHGMKQVLRKGGRILIADTVVGPRFDPDLVAGIERHWHCHFARLGEYTEHCSDYRERDLSSLAKWFWVATYQLIVAERRWSYKIDQTLQTHCDLHTALATGQLRHILLELKVGK